MTISREMGHVNTQKEIETAKKKLALSLTNLFKGSLKDEKPKVLKTYSDWVKSSLTTGRAVLNQIDLKVVESDSAKVTLEHFPSKFRVTAPNQSEAEHQLRLALNAHIKNWVTTTGPGLQNYNVLATTEKIVSTYRLDTIK